MYEVTNKRNINTICTFPADTTDEVFDLVKEFSEDEKLANKISNWCKKSAPGKTYNSKLVSVSVKII